MSAPFIWIIVPLLVAGILLIPWDERALVVIASVITAILAVMAWLIPIDVVVSFGNTSIKLSSSLEILGRNLTLTTADQPLLSLIYGAAFFWFVACGSIRLTRKLIPLGMAISALWVASLAVQPFLYAALLIELAVLLAIPLVSSKNRKPGRGILRFLIFQSLAMPLILFSGWLIVGIEANPGDTNLIAQAALLLGLGFTFLLAVFPFSTWLPLLVEETPPYLAGFIYWSFPTAGLLFLIKFLEHYAWLRSAQSLPNILAYSGILMVVAGGFLSLFQKHLGRIMAYGVMVETGFSLIALSMGSQIGIALFFALFIPRLLSLIGWSYALTVLQNKIHRLNFHDVKGWMRSFPLVSITIGMASLSMVGVPIMAGFPVREAVYELLSHHSMVAAFLSFLGILGLTIAIIRTLAVLSMAPDGTPWEGSELSSQKRVLIAISALLILFGLFPQWIGIIMERLPFMFQNLGH